MRSASRPGRLDAAIALAVAIAGSLVLAAPAGAGLLEWDSDSGALTYGHGDPAERYQAHDVHVSVVGDEIRFADTTALVVVDAEPCRPDGNHAALCDAAAVRFLGVALGDLPDSAVNDTAVPSVMCGGDGSDRLIGGEAQDFLDGDGGRDELAGRGGRDGLEISLALLCPLEGASSPGEVLDGGPGVDEIHGGPSADVLRGGDGDDSLRGYAGDDTIVGGDGRDDLVGFEGDDELRGDGGNDLLFGAAGDDRLEGGDGRDTLGMTVRVDADGLGGDDAAVTLVEDGDDDMDGGPGDDLLIAGPGERLLDFTDPLATERGGARDRTLESPHLNGDDVLRGGAGVDEVTYFNRALPVRATPDGVPGDGSPGERDRIDGDVEAVNGGAGDDVLLAGRGGSALFGDFGADRLVGGPGPDLLRGGATDGSADVLSGAGGDDDMAGGGGGDVLDGGHGRDALAGDDGEDTLRGGAEVDTLWGGTAGDRLEGGAGDDCLHGFASASGTPSPACPAPQGVAPQSGADGDDSLAGGPGRDHIEGGGGADTADYRDAPGRVLAVLAGSPASRPPGRWADADVLAADVEGVRGGAAADTLLGNAADNLLDGGPGADHLDGGAGQDRLRGGPGRDLAVARDADADDVRCGTGDDLAVVDADDEVVALRADVCELADGAGGRRTGRLARVLGRPACPVELRLPGAGRVFTLALATIVPWGTRVRAEGCATRVRRGRRPAARVAGGTFSVQRSRRTAALTLRLRGGDPRACEPGSRAELRRLSVRSRRLLVVDGRAADVRAARAAWTVIDRCDGTRVEMTRGRGLVHAGGRAASGPLRAPHARFVPRGRP